MLFVATDSPQEKAVPSLTEDQRPGAVYRLVKDFFPERFQVLWKDLKKRFSTDELAEEAKLPTRRGKRSARQGFCPDRSRFKEEVTVEVLKCARTQAARDSRVLPDDREDVAQDATLRWLRTLQNPNTPKPEVRRRPRDKWGKWIFFWMRITLRRVVVDRNRQNDRRPSTPGIDVHDIIGSDAQDPLVVSELRECLYAMVEALPAQQREAVHLYLNGTMPSPRPNAIKQAYHNAMNTLTRKMRTRFRTEHDHD